MNWYLLIPAFINAVVLILLTRRYVHIFQLESYKQPQYVKYIETNKIPQRFYLFFIITVAVQLLLNFILKPMLSVYISEALFILFSIILLIPELTVKSKKPLVYTNRIKRLFVIIAVLSLILLVVLEFISTRPDYMTGVWGYFCLIFAPYMVLGAAKVMEPIEKSIQQGFIKDAKRILAERPDLIKIAITGSYGKTSTKFILSTILSEKFNVLVTPKSYNTPMGVVKVIRNMLDIEHEIFVCEMGAKQIGDIKELCDIVQPIYGLITTVGKQHLETFGSVENIAKGKYELIESLPSDGTAFFPALNEICVEMYNKTKIEKYLFGDNGYVSAENITVSSLGSAFTLIGPDGSRTECTTVLLGKYNIDNILGCAAVCFKLGMTAREIARGIAKVKPVEHRLQLINKGSITIIDDAYNSNPSGAQMALEVLSGFKKNRIIITPGIVELGEEHESEHIRLGKKIAECVDIAILVGPKRTKPILDGIKEAGFTGRIEVVKSFNEALSLLQTISFNGDTVLLENDLPDNFDE